MLPTTDAALHEWILAQADDQLILAHRDSEWTGHAPILEEDIAISNIAQDELGHANLWYGLLSQLNGSEPDALVFQRGAADWRNLQMLELPKGDWAFTMLRQFLCDAYEHVLLEEALQSSYQPIAEIAARIRREELYHLRHTTAWMRRLSLGTEESHRRMQHALDALWPYTGQLFGAVAQPLLDARIVPDPLQVRERWLALVLPMLHEGTLKIPAFPAHAPTRSDHTPELSALLHEMQEVARLDHQADW